MTGPTILWRAATKSDVPAIITLLRDDPLGVTREAETIAPYLAAFDAMQAEATNHLIVGERQGAIIATYQITFITGISLRAARRAQIESLRVATGLRSQGVGAALIYDAEARARAAGCALIQLTSNDSRTRARDFYLRQGFSASHTGFKKLL